MLARFLLASVASLLGALAAADAVSPPAAPPNLNTTQVSVLSASEVVEILDRTSEWYRTLGLPQQNSLQPSEVLILYANRQIADKVVDLVVELARADAELLSSEANAAQASADKSAATSLKQQRDQLAAQRQSIQQEITADQQKRSSAGGAGKELETKLAELQGELAMNAARANLLDTMGEFVNQRDPKSADAEALKAHIDAIAASIPLAAAAPAPQTGTTPAATSPAASALLNSAVERSGVRDGIWDLAKNVFDLRAKIKAIKVIDARSKDLTDLFAKYSEAPRARLQSYAAGSDALASAADSATGVALQNLRSQFDTLAWLFKQTSSILLPLSKEKVLLEQYRHNLGSWRDTTLRQYHEAWHVLAARLGIVLGLLASVFVLAEVWRRAVLRYVHEPRRRYQFLLVRTIVMWVVILAIVGLSFVTEISSFATFAGLITAGVAVAMQSVLVSIVGYFFLIGKYGIRVGDRVQIGNVIGEVMDLGLVRMHLMEFHGEGPLGPTGRVVAFPNLIVFQATGGLFKQLPGVNLSWHEITLPLPAVSDYTALKQRLLAAVRDVTKEYRSEIERQSREIQDMSLSGAGADAEAHVQMHIVDGHMQALIGYPVHSQHAADIDERVSQAVLAVLSVAKE
ncbi:MAG TPA: mechanosensitive ion channel domain-containing protein [Steroidobacteraceae bacterium]|nr:mechanosensitive ion channel domain-containing protein [Steroidobacteraceae bacterium]